ncbi:VOC family protein [Enterococcus pingfangensis]|uniref:VOC family protein n=1 Tax=Enterococcus pingfangensis TaxID=2559924 RepID=UPI0010F92A5D|nr:VOC family protein [Enterococcus pingfangensis]
MDIYLHFTDQAAEAITFYEDVFKTKPAQIMTFGQMPPDDNNPVDDSIKDLVLHANLQINDTNVMISDSPESLASPRIIGNTVALVFNATTAEEALEIFQRLAENGTVLLPLEKTFWAELYGMVKDQYDVNWYINFL